MKLFAMLGLVIATGYAAKKKTHRRRSDGGFVHATIEADLCLSVNEFVKSLENDLFAANTGDDAKPTLDATKMVFEWCNGFRTRRRSGQKRRFASALRDDDEDFDYEAQFGDLSAYGIPGPHPDSKDFLSAVMEWAGSEPLRRRPSPSLPNFMWQQCVAYTYGAGRLIRENHASGEKIVKMFAANAVNGTNTEKMEGCGAVVNEVNAALRNGAWPDLKVVKESASEGRGANGTLVERLEKLAGSPESQPTPQLLPGVDVELVVTQSKNIADVFGVATTTMLPGLAIAVYKLFELCNTYADMVTQLKLA